MQFLEASFWRKNEHDQIYYIFLNIITIFISICDTKINCKPAYESL